MDSNMAPDITHTPTREDAENAAAAWLLRHSDSCWSAADETELARWLKASPSHRVAFMRLESVWVDADRLKSLSAGFPQGQVPPRGAIERSPFFTLKRAEAQDEEKGIHLNVPQDPAPDLPAAPVAPGKRLRALALAASILLVLVGAITFYSIDVTGRGRSYSTSVGGLATIPTADGSVITLNTDSEIEVRFSPHERSIKLKKGEAFFEVAKDPARPFIVDAHERRVVAVGTKFLVRLNFDAIHVAVTEGKVRVEEPASRILPAWGGFDREENPEKRLIVAGAVADVEAEKISLRQRPIPEIEQALSWRTGYIVLTGAPLAEAVAEFNRYNSRQLSLEDPELATLEVEGNFRSNNVEGFVRLLEQGFAVKAEAGPDGRIVLRKK